MTAYRQFAAAILTVNAGLFLAAGAQAGSWQNNAPFGASLNGDLYTPTTLSESPAILVALHYCTGRANNAHGWFDSLADQHGFYVIAPDAGKQCFDSSAKRAGDPAAVVGMVQWVIDNKGANPDRVFAAGFSSGGCMTNVLLTVYPDVFKGGAAMPGFPGGGWPAGDTTCTKCGSSPPSTDGKYWGDIARGAFAWDGKYPCSQQWVGGSDEYNFQAWLPALVAQFQDLAGLDGGAVGTGAPNGWNRTDYKDADGNVRLQTNVKPGQKHDLTGSNLAGEVVTFLGLDKPTGACGLAGAEGMETVGNPSGSSASSGEGALGSEGSTSTEPASSSSSTVVTTAPPVSLTTSPATNATTEPNLTNSGGTTTVVAGAPAVPPPVAPSVSAPATSSTAPVSVATDAVAAPGPSDEGSEGCSCRVAGQPKRQWLTGLVTACFGMLVVGRRRMGRRTA